MGFDVTKHKTPVNVALGGGGAKGFVHIGVLEELVEQNYQIVSIVGTSVGAMIAALFAYNCAVRHRNCDEPQRYAIKAVKDLCISENFNRFKDLNLFSMFRRGLLKGEYLLDWLENQLISEAGKPLRFEELDFDLTVTATNAYTGKSLIFNSANASNNYIHRAVRASASIQGIFRDITVDINGESVRCWDGGATGNCRYDIAHFRNPHLPTIASSLTYRGEPRSIDQGFFSAGLRPFKIGMHTISILMRSAEDAMENLLNLDPRVKERIHIVRPNLANVRTTDFGIDEKKMQELFENGRWAIREKLKSLSR